MRNPFRYFNSSPELIRLTVLMYVLYPFRRARSRIWRSNVGSELPALLASAPPATPPSTGTGVVVC
jgi:hypothetical protein